MLLKYNAILKNNSNLAFAAKYKKLNIVIFLIKKESFVIKKSIINSFNWDK